MFEQCATRAIRLVLRICPIQSGSLVLLGWAISQVLLQMTVIKQIHLGKRKPWWGEAQPLEGEGATEGADAKKVGTNDGTTKFGIPCIWLAALVMEADTGGKPAPETARADAWDCKLDEKIMGTPPAMR